MKIINITLPLSQRLNRMLAARSLSHKVTKLVLKSFLMLMGLLFSQTSLAATCNYEIVDEWNTGFQASVSIINDSSEVVEDWQVSWAWTDGTTLQNGWDAVYDCTGSACTATPPSSYARS